jgi:hypothetical protein
MPQTTMDKLTAAARTRFSHLSTVSPEVWRAMAPRLREIGAERALAAAPASRPRAAAAPEPKAADVARLILAARAKADGKASGGRG